MTAVAWLELGPAGSDFPQHGSRWLCSAWYVAPGAATAPTPAPAQATAAPAAGKPKGKKKRKSKAKVAGKQRRNQAPEGPI